MHSIKTQKEKNKNTAYDVKLRDNKNGINMWQGELRKKYNSEKNMKLLRNVISPDLCTHITMYFLVGSNVVKYNNVVNHNKIPLL